jgi:digeranylgeranylglycerophospholipid reductase
MNEVAIIGAGPAGLATAIKLKEEGFDSVVFEEHESIGTPENCSGLVSKSGMDALGVDVSEVTLNKIRGAKIFAPDGNMIRVTRNSTVAYLMDRAAFDKMLLKKAQNLNIHIATNTKLIDIRKNTLFVQKNGRGEIRKAEKIIGADGVNSTVRHLMELKTKKEDFVHTVQATATGEFEKEYVSVYTGDFASGFFAWVIPINERKAKIGMGAKLGVDVSDKFKEFIREKLPGIRVYNAKSFLVPYGEPLKGIVKDNMALVGDSAFQTKATSGGGIIFGMRAGNILAQTIADSVKHKTSLKEYEKRCAPLNRELKMHWKIRKYANSLSEEQTNKLFSKLKNKGIEEFLQEHGDMDNPSEFISKLASSPRYWFMAKTLLSIARA